MNRSVLLSFTRNVSSLLAAGLTLTESLDICSKMKGETGIFASGILSDVRKGRSLSDAFSRSDVKDFFFLTMIRIGERNCSADEIFSLLSVYLEKKDENRKRLLQVSIYPAFIVLLTVLVSVFIFSYVYPRISVIAAGIGGGNVELEKSIRKAFIGFGLFFFLLAALVVVSVTVSVSGKFIGSVKKFSDGVKVRVPFLGKVAVASALSNVFFVAKILSEKGSSPVQCMEESVEAAGNIYIEEKMKVILKMIKNGESFTKALSCFSWVPDILRSWGTIGEKTGRSSEMFGGLYEYYRKENEFHFNLLAGALEPAFILGAGMFLMSFVFSFVVPVFRALGGIGNV